MTQPFEQIEPFTFPIGRLLSEHYFVVPPNQREYSWESNDQVARFWDDLLSVIQVDRQQNPTKLLGHFLGPIVVVGSRTCTNEDRHRVIDGQQRITTITCLCRVLLEFVDQHADPEQKRRLVTKLLPCISADVGGATLPRVILNRDDSFYRTSVVSLASEFKRQKYWSGQNTERPAPRVRLIETLNYFHQQVTTYLDKQEMISGASGRDKGIEDLVYSLTDLSYVLYVRVMDYRMAYRLFETLNDRGLDLSQADLVKNSLLEAAEKIGKAEVDKSLGAWSAMLNEIENQEVLEVKELLQYSYTSRIGHVKAESLFDSVSVMLEAGSISPSAYATGLSDDSQYWTQFLQGNLGHWNANTIDSRYFLVHIKPIWKKHATPLLLRVAERFDKKTKTLELENSLRAIESYLFREGTIRRISVSSLEKVLGDAARIVADPSQPDRAFVDHLKSKAPDAEFRESFAVASAKGRLAFYIAWRLEQHALGSGTFDIGTISPAKQSKNTHLEHIMPRKPSADWGGIHRLDDFRIYLDRIGNHLVLDRKINSSVKNGKFADKLNSPKKNGRDYKTQQLALPRQMLQKRKDWLHRGKWTFESIKKRQQFLADTYALKVWNIAW